MAGNQNFFTDNQDLLFHMEKRIDAKAIFDWLSDEEKDALNAKNPEEYRTNWIEMLTAFGEVAADVATRAKKVEDEPIELINGEVELPPSINQNLAQLKEFGIAGLSIHPHFGGMGAPFVYDMIGCELVNRACPSTMLNAAWYGPIAHVIESFGSKELQEAYIPRIATGELSGNMALTEPDAGSDLSAIRSYAEKQSDGSYKLFGTKRFISNGNGDISLVLAKTTKNAPGLGQLSLFLCPRKIDGSINYKIAGIEKKVALHGSATCELAYDGSKAFILGQENQGYRYMLRLMNDSRIGVGFQGIGLIEGAYRDAHAYACERKTWGKALVHHELIAEKLLDMEVEVYAARSLGIHCAFERTMELLGERYIDRCPSSERESVNKRLSRHQRNVRHLTPLIKYWTGERSFMLARTGYQILGGYGFTKEYKAEWYLRESLIYSVYEGTSQIQALMCVKDTMKQVIQNPTKLIQNTIEDSYKGLFLAEGLDKKLLTLKQITNKSILDIMIKLIKTNMKISLSKSSKSDLFKMAKIIAKELIKFDNLSPALLHAERLCTIKCLETIASCLIEDAKIDPSRSWIAERFCHNAVLEAKYLRRQIEQDETTLMTRLNKAVAKT